MTPGAAYMSPPISDLYHFFSFFFNDTATTEIYTFSLHDALPISRAFPGEPRGGGAAQPRAGDRAARSLRWASQWRRHMKYKGDRKSTRLNSSHLGISYAVFCLKKKK